jgi:putative endonuclease
LKKSVAVLLAIAPLAYFAGVETLVQTKPWWVYVLRCRDTSFYCGITKDMERRLGQHNAGKGARYTRGRGPVEVLYSWTVPAREVALRQERAFKALSRAKKILFLKELNPGCLSGLLRDCTNAASGKS